MCSCLKELCTQEQIAELSKLLDLGEQSFDTFSLDYYSPLPWPGESLTPRENMEFIFEVCSNYARKFGKFYFRNLFLTGAPGLGKTFLSACIARTVSEKGFSVVYDTAVNIFARFEEQKFARDRQEAGEARDETRRYLGCDLLILDDLGSELTTPFVQSALYTLINSRLTADKADGDLLQPDHGPGAPAVHPPDRLPAGGGVPGAPLLRGGHPAFAEAEALIQTKRPAERSPVPPVVFMKAACSEMSPLIPHSGGLAPMLYRTDWPDTGNSCTPLSLRLPQPARSLS